MCEKFMPPMPSACRGTAFHYFKRFYLNNSVMDYHPKEILVTSVYLACKVEEFNVSMQQFVTNIPVNFLVNQQDWDLIHNYYRGIKIKPPT